MYARSTTIRGNPQNMDDGIAYVYDKVMPAVEQMDGSVGLSMLCNRDSGMVIVTSAWADRDAMRRSADAIRPIRDRAGEIFGGMAAAREWEIAVLHRMHETHDDCCARVIWMMGDPDGLESMLDTFRMAMLPRLEDLPGFCSVSMMVDRDSGESAATVTYENRDMMMTATSQAKAMREEFARRMGRRISDVQEFDLMIAHLRVPETV
jgi:heme-degrading monooxygenase HmoA